MSHPDSATPDSTAAHSASPSTQSRTATLTRMVLPDHICPYGVRAREMLEVAGYAIDEHILSTRDEVEAFKAKHGLDTTPLIEIDGETIGGCDALEDYLAEHGQAAQADAAA